MAETKTKTTTNEAPGRVAELESMLEDLGGQLNASEQRVLELSERVVELEAQLAEQAKTDSPGQEEIENLKNEVLFLQEELARAEQAARQAGGFALKGFQPVPKSPEINGQALVEFTHIKGNGQLLYAERTALIGEAGWSPKLIANLLSGMAVRCVNPGVFGNPRGATVDEQLSFCPPFSVERKLGVAIWIE